ncbi:hypothetical protein EMCRGX_G034589 [Ephydatia muelleri]
MAAVGRRLWGLTYQTLRQTSTAAKAGELVKPPIQLFGIDGRYAHALYSVAAKNKILEKVEKELDDFQKLASKYPQLASFITNPTLNKQQKQAGIGSILKEQQFSDTTAKFFGALVENNRLRRTLGVIKAYKTLMGAHRGEVLCTVTTAKPIDDKNKKELESVLKGFAGKNAVLKLNQKVDASLIGGMVVEIGDKYIDMSTSTKIKKIVAALKGAL